VSAQRCLHSYLARLAAQGLLRSGKGPGGHLRYRLTGDGALLLLHHHSRQCRSASALAHEGAKPQKQTRGIRTLLRDGVVLARAVQDPRLSDEILKSVRRKLESSWPRESEAAFLVFDADEYPVGQCAE